jgi:hypothetical protein
MPRYRLHRPRGEIVFPVRAFGNKANNVDLQCIGRLKDHPVGHVMQENHEGIEQVIPVRALARDVEVEIDFRWGEERDHGGISAA